MENKIYLTGIDKDNKRFYLKFANLDSSFLWLTAHEDRLIGYTLRNRLPSYFREEEFMEM